MFSTMWSDKDPGEKEIRLLSSPKTNLHPIYLLGLEVHDKLLQNQMLNSEKYCF